MRFVLRCATPIARCVAALGEILAFHPYSTGPEGGKKSAMDQDAGRTGISHKPLILYIEGDCDTREAYASLLRNAEFRVAEASNGADAVERAVALRADLVLLDLALVGAYEALRRIRKNPKTALVPVIALSACAVRDDQAEACDGFLLKPQDVADVVQLARDLLLSADRARVTRGPRQEA